MLDGTVVRDFHKLYYDEGRCHGGTWRATRWMGIETLKCPLDLWVYQEILYETRPDVILETGTHRGGSACYLACICDLIGNGRVISIDVADFPFLPQHPRITYLRGSSVSVAVEEKIRSLIRNGENVMAVLDSDHSRDHVIEELRMYSQFVTKGCYLIVEDTNINGHPTMPDFGPGPMEAVVEFASDSRNFEIDAGKEKFLLTFNPRGYLKRISDF